MTVPEGWRYDSPGVMAHEDDGEVSISFCHVGSVGDLPLDQAIKTVSEYISDLEVLHTELVKLAYGDFERLVAPTVLDFSVVN